MSEHTEIKTYTDEQTEGIKIHKYVQFDSLSIEWATPQDFYEKLDQEFGFELDVCSTIENAKCSKFYTKAEDGLKQEWTGVCWCNPPYGREIKHWMKKAYESSLKGATVVCLIPARTDTQWWHDYVIHAKEIRYVKGRLKFGGATNSAPFALIVAVFQGVEHE
jgi:phage N-6-adenine-methyltransferase